MVHEYLPETIHIIFLDLPCITMMIFDRDKRINYTIDDYQNYHCKYTHTTTMSITYREKYFR
jgi:hypothetical protein